MTGKRFKELLEHAATLIHDDEDTGTFEDGLEDLRTICDHHLTPEDRGDEDEPDAEDDDSEEDDEEGEDE